MNTVKFSNITRKCWETFQVQFELVPARSDQGAGKMIGDKYGVQIAFTYEASGILTGAVLANLLNIPMFQIEQYLNGELDKASAS